MSSIYPAVHQIIVPSVDRVATANGIFNASHQKVSNNKQKLNFVTLSTIKEAPVGWRCFTLFNDHISLRTLLDFSSIEVAIRAGWIMMLNCGKCLSFFLAFISVSNVFFKAMLVALRFTPVGK